MEALFFNPGLANSSGLIDSEVLLIVVTAARYTFPHAPGGPAHGGRGGRGHQGPGHRVLAQPRRQDVQPQVRQLYLSVLLIYVPL